MPNPKRKHSRSRRDKRRANYRLSKPTLVACSQCKTLKPPHIVCPECGTYGGESVLKIEE
ncbi:MAG: 50S ribosomal protein L32 [Deltaproteobacteria bacterium]|nr:50S ribosomal protein L32 [Deltaproteobacteria bacterium]